MDWGHRGSKLLLLLYLNNRCKLLRELGRLLLLEAR